MTHRYLSAVTMTGPEPDPEYHECNRCGVRLKQHSLLKTCEDCEGLNAFKPPRTGSTGGFPPIDPAFEVFLHYPTRPHIDGTVNTLEALKIPYFSLFGTKDPLEVDWALGLLNPERAPRWPIVVITSYGRPIDHWEGFNLNRINELPFRRAAALSATTATQESRQAA